MVALDTNICVGGKFSLNATSIGLQFAPFPRIPVLLFYGYDDLFRGIIYH
jgi:hypothetical protein